MTAIDGFRARQAEIDGWLSRHKAASLQRMGAPADAARGAALTPAQGNLLVRADNVEGLAALMPFYRGQVKFIYADPPYNTGNQTWVYSDALAGQLTKEWLDSVVGVDDMERSTKWMCMMYVRLRLMHELLTLDGSIALSIDEPEAMNLRYLLEVVFGASNHIGTFRWKTKAKSSLAKFFADVHEYIYVYAKDRSALETANPDGWSMAKPNADLVRAEELRLMAEDLTHAERTAAMKQFYRDLTTHLADELASEGIDPEEATVQAKKRVGSLSPYVNFDDAGLYRDGPLDSSAGYDYDVIHPTTGLPVAKPSRGWGAPQGTMERWIAEGRVNFGPTEANVPRRKMHMHEYMRTLPDSHIDIPGARGTAELAEIFGGKAPFDFPKPSELIQMLVEMTTAPGDVILDPFSGSGTTAHAVLRINAEARLENPSLPPRRFIGIQMPEEYETVEDKAANDANREAIKGGAAPQRSGDIFHDITRVRVDRVISGYTIKAKKRGADRDVSGLGGTYTAWAIEDEEGQRANLVNEWDEINTDEVGYAAVAAVAAAHALPGESYEFLPDGDGPRAALGEHDAVFVYLGQHHKRLTGSDLEQLQAAHPGKRVHVYGDGCAFERPPAGVIFRNGAEGLGLT